MKLKYLLLSSVVLAGVALAKPVHADEIKTNTDKIEHLKVTEITLDSSIKNVKSKLKSAKTAKPEIVKSTTVSLPETVSKNTFYKSDDVDTLETQLHSLEAEKATVTSKRISLEKQDIKEKEKAEAKAAQEAKEAKEAEEKAKADEAARIKAEQEAQAKAAAQTKEQTIAKAETGTVTPGSVPVVQYESGNTYPVGQCTWGVKQLAPWVGNWWGNANMWADSARARGFKVGTTPVPGSVAMWPNDGFGYGHVAYVTDVESETRIKVAESNYAGNQYISDFRGWFNPQANGPVYYIYPN